jgi:hypothetical protein
MNHVGATFTPEVGWSRELEIVEDAGLLGRISDHVGGSRAFGFVGRLAQDVADFGQMLIGHAGKHFLHRPGFRIGHQAMSLGQIFVADAVADGGLILFDKLAIDRGDLVRKMEIFRRRWPQFEMRRSALFHADIQDDLAAIATDHFQVRIHHAHDVNDPLFRVALGGRERVTFARAQSLPDLRLRDFVEPVEVERSDPQVLREEQRSSHSEVNKPEPHVG